MVEGSGPHLRALRVPAGKYAVLWIDHPSVSRRHAQIVVAAGKARLEDLGSKNGTILNGAALARPAALSDGDKIRIGVESMVFRTLSQLESTRTERPE